MLLCPFGIILEKKSVRISFFFHALGAVQEVKGSPIFLTFKKENMIKFSHEQRKK